MLDRLVDELPLLRRPAAPPRPRPAGPVARRMTEAVWPHRRAFVTPMAAVAGAVADEMLATLTGGARLTSAYVNNGGDIAVHLAADARLTLGVVGDIAAPAIGASAVLTGGSPVRGIATSGWRGRSWSFGIADAVTVLARNAAAADVAATLIANEVRCDHPAIARAPADEVDDNTDLGGRLVTVSVGALEPDAAASALARGARCAQRMHRAGHVLAAMLVLQGHHRVVGAAGSLTADAGREREDG